MTRVEQKLYLTKKVHSLKNKNNRNRVKKGRVNMRFVAFIHWPSVNHDTKILNTTQRDKDIGR